jgi:hypothetical protein
VATTEGSGEALVSPPGQADGDSGKLPRWRRILVATLVVISVVLAPLALLSVFVRNQLLDTDTYVDTVAPLASDPDIVETAANRLTTRLFNAVDVEQEAKEALPERAAFLAGPLADGLEQFTREAALRFLESDEFQRIWRNANRRAHELVQAALTGESDRAVKIENHKVVLDLTPVAEEVRARLRDREITLFDNVPIGKLALKYELFDASQIESAQSLVRLLDRVRIVLVVLVFLFLAVALALSGNRRRTLIRWGIGLVIAMAFTAAVIGLSRNAYLNAVADDTLPRSAAGSAFDIVVRFLRNGIRLLAVLGIVVALAAFLSGPSRPAVRIRTTARRLVSGNKAADPEYRPSKFGIWIAAHRVALRWAGVAVAVLVLITWDRPRPLTILVIALVLVVYLALLEFLGRGSERALDSSSSSEGSDS